jgi:hypothetical protein
VCRASHSSGSGLALRPDHYAVASARTLLAVWDRLHIVPVTAHSGMEIGLFGVMRTDGYRRVRCEDRKCLIGTAEQSGDSPALSAVSPFREQVRPLWTAGSLRGVVRPRAVRGLLPVRFRSGVHLWKRALPADCSNDECGSARRVSSLQVITSRRRRCACRALARDLPDVPANPSPAPPSRCRGPCGPGRTPGRCGPPGSRPAR